MCVRPSTTRTMAPASSRILQVPADRGLGHAEVTRRLADAQRAAGEPLEDPAPDRMRARGERPIEHVTVSHLVNNIMPGSGPLRIACASRCPAHCAPSAPRATSTRCARAARCRASSRPTTTACTSRSSAAPARARPRSWPRSWPASWARAWGCRSPSWSMVESAGARPRRARPGDPGADRRQRRAEPRRRLPARARCPSPCRAEALDPEFAADVVWFDALVTNVDRTPRNPNLLVWHGRTWLIDHGAALFRQHGDAPLAETADAPVPLLATTSCSRRGPIARPTGAWPRRRSRRSRAVAAVPDDWLGPDPAARRAGHRRLPAGPARRAARLRGGGRTCPPLSRDAPFAYAILRVVPHVERGERLNVGVVCSAASATSSSCAPQLDEARLAALAPDSIRRRALAAGRAPRVVAGRSAGGPGGRAVAIRALRLARRAVVDDRPAVRGAHRADGATRPRRSSGCSGGSCRSESAGSAPLVGVEARGEHAGGVRAQALDVPRHRRRHLLERRQR